MLLWITLVAIVLLGAALASGIVDRAPLSYPMLFLVLGLALGGGTLGLIAVGPRTPALDALATISLALVLFLDAVTLEVDELRREWRVPFLALGPVTVLTLLGVASAAHLFLALAWVPSLLLGAALASTDPIVVRDVVRNEQIPRPVRRALTIEAAMNDVVVLPVVLILIAVSQASLHGPLAWLGFLASLLLLSPVVGLGVGGVGAWLMGRADARFSIRREYQALYGLGLVLGAYAVAKLAVIRPLAIGLVFLRATLSTTARAFIAWFGPRGLSALLLILLVVQAGLPAGDRLLAITGLVVLVSVIVHGVTATPFSQRYGRKVAQAKQTLPEERDGSASGLFQEEAAAVPRISADELARRLAGAHPPVVLDVRRRAQYAAGPGQIPGSVRA